jgi:hypothetical protein
VTPEELARKHPRLYHVTEPSNWKGIQKHGLLSTSRILSLFEVPAARRVTIEGQCWNEERAIGALGTRGGDHHRQHSLERRR